MFYHQQALTKGGPFYICWVASCWPEQFSRMQNRQIINANLIEICERMEGVMLVESQRPFNRFSLRLSCHIMDGLVKLYHKKITILIDDLALFYKNLRKHNTILNRNQTPQRRSVKRKAPEDPEDLMEANCVVNISEITIQEPDIPFRNIIDDGFGELQPHEQMLDNNILDCEYGLNVNSFPPMNLNNHTSMEVVNAVDLPVNDMQLTVSKDAQIPEILVTSETNNPPPPKIRKTTESRGVLEEIIVKDINEQNTIKTRKPRKKKKLVKDEVLMISSTEMKANMRGYIELRCRDTGESVHQIPPFPGVNKLFENPNFNISHKSSFKLQALFRRNAVTVPVKLSFNNENKSQEDMLIRAPENESLRRSFAANSIILRKELSKRSLLQKSVENLHIQPSTPQITFIEEDNTDLNKSAAITTHCSINVMEIDAEDVHNVLSETISVSKCLEIRREDKLTDDNRTIEAIPERSADTSLNMSVEEFDEASFNRTAVMVRTPSPTESVKEIRQILKEEWDVKGVFEKILNAKNAGIKPITVETLVMNNQQSQKRAPSQRMIAAKAFSSLLRLKKHGFIEISKKPNSLEINDINFTQKCISFSNPI